MVIPRRSPVHRTVRGKETPPVRRLPLQGHMAPAHGERRDDCDRYMDCLTAHVQAHKGSDKPAMCRNPCTFYRPAPRLDPCDYIGSGMGKMEVM